MATNLDTLVTVFGGSGFLGRSVVRALCKRDYRVRVAVRRPELAGHLQPLGRVGQIHAVQANLRYPTSIEAAMHDSHIAINLVGILAEGGAQTFDAVQAAGAAAVAKAAAAAGARMVHVSAIGADENSPSRYARAKAAGEQAVLSAIPSATILRPSVVFGPEDQFTNRFAALAVMSPVLPLIGGGVTRLQPVYVGDVATAVADAVDGKTRAGATYELGGPEVLTMREIMEIILHTIERQSHAGLVAVRHRQIAGAVAAVRPGTAETDARSGHAFAQRQCGVGGGESRGAHAGGARNCAGFAGSDRAAISLALPQGRAVRAQGRVISLPSRPSTNGSRERAPDDRLRERANKKYFSQDDKKSPTAPSPVQSGRACRRRRATTRTA